MKVVKQTKLYFKEGNSDKVYEVDLADVGADLYVVNFRYGRRGAVLKEGSKTTTPVPLTQAESLFDGLEMEKRKKGYLTDTGLPDVPTLPVAPVSTEKPATPDEAVRRRVQALASGTDTAKTAWKPSRVIWQVGERRLTDMLPLLVRLIERAGGVKADDLHRYSVLWAIGRCAAVMPGTEFDAALVRTVETYATNPNYSDKVRRIAGEALLYLLTGAERHAYLTTKLNSLADDLRTVVLTAEADQLLVWLTTNVLNSVQPDYHVLEVLYALLPDYPVVRRPLMQLLREIPFRPNYFRHVRHLLKLAELRDDAETLGILAYRFEKTRAFFKKPKRSYYSYDEDSAAKDPAIFISALGVRVKPKAELKKPDSRLAYSHATQVYLRRRMRLQLTAFGTANDLNYVRLATAILLSYDKQTDYKAAYVQSEYTWNASRRQYDTLQRSIPAYSDSVLLNQILFGAGTRLELYGGSFWRAKVATPVNGQAQETASTAPAGLFGSLVSRVTQLLGGKQPDATVHNSAPSSATDSDREEPYPELWDKLPQAYVQLLVKARVDEVHAFAYRNLINHPDYAAIEAKIDLSLLRQLLVSSFEIPARWAVDIVRKRMGSQADPALVALLLNSPVADVRQLGQEFITAQPGGYLSDSAFLADILLSVYADNRSWLLTQLSGKQLTDNQQQTIIPLLLNRLYSLANDDAADAILADITPFLNTLADAQIQAIPEALLVQLQQSLVAGCRRLVGELTLRRTSLPQPTLLARLLADPNELVAQMGQQVWQKVAPAARQEQQTYGLAVLAELIPTLLKTEATEGQQHRLVQFILADMQPEIGQLVRETVLRLVYSTFGPAQELGAFALKQLPADTLTMRQIVALGNHETLALRQFAWHYFTQNPARIRYERDEAIRLLDAHWDDTRAAAMQFFRDQFTADDWSAEALVGITDSVRPDIQAFGRELISRFFTDEHGPDYLMKLSQHPTAAVQLFTTNYLQRYAANDSERLRSLSFYFRTVLMRAHQGRVAKDRVLAFLRQEGLTSEANALFVSRLLAEVSATSALTDKATCLRTLRDLNLKYPTLDVPFVREAIPERV